jgi:hypothetical protein
VISQNTQEGRARDIEVRNRERTWILCFGLDRSFSAQMGKPSSVKEDYIIQNVHNWYKSPVAIPWDVSLAGYTVLQRILSRSLEFLYSGTDSASGLLVNCDYLVVIKSFETQILAWHEEWTERRNSEDQTSPTSRYKRMISQFYFNYAMLVLNSFGLQNAMEHTPLNICHFFARVYSSAVACATIVRDQLGPNGFMKYSPDSHFVLTSYAVLTLLKLIRPEFKAFLEDERGILTLVHQVADVLDNMAANPLHTPALYSGFLRALISAKWDSSLSNTGLNGEGDEKPPVSPDGEQGNNIQVHIQPPSYGQQQQQQHSYGQDASFLLNEFQFDDGEMGPVADISTFPPTMAPYPPEDSASTLTVENILSSGFWDSMLVPGYNSMDAFSGGFVFGANGSGLITPRYDSPAHSGVNTPGRFSNHPSTLTQNSINVAFDQCKDGIGIDS